MKNTFPISYSSSTLYNPESNPFEFIARVDLGHACLPSVSHSTTTNSIGKHHFGAPQKPTEYWASRRVVGCGWFGRDETEILLICIMPPDTILILIAFIQEELASPVAARKQSHRLAVSLLVQFNNPATPFLHISTAPERLNLSNSFISVSIWQNADFVAETLVALSQSVPLQISIYSHNANKLHLRRQTEQRQASDWLILGKVSWVQSLDSHRL